MKALLALALVGLAVSGGPSAEVVARGADGAEAARLALPSSGEFALEYRHSYYRVPARETFKVADDGSFALVAVSSRSEAVLDYYEIEGSRARRDGVWTLRPAVPARFETMALAATAVGRRTLVAGGRRAALWGGDVHLRIGVEQ
jgi:Domain of unknown function (DUF1850)